MKGKRKEFAHMFWMIILIIYVYSKLKYVLFRVRSMVNLLGFKNENKTFFKTPKRWKSLVLRQDFSIKLKTFWLKMKFSKMYQKVFFNVIWIMRLFLAIGIKLEFGRLTAYMPNISHFFVSFLEWFAFF